MTSLLLLKSSTLPFPSPLSVNDFYFSEEMENRQRTSTTTSATNWHLCPHTCFCSCCMEDLCVLQSQRPSSPTNELGSDPFCLLEGSTAAILWLSLLYHPSVSPSLPDNSISTQTWCNFSHLKTRTLHHPDLLPAISQLPLTAKLLWKTACICCLQSLPSFSWIHSMILNPMVISSFSAPFGNHLFFPETLSLLGLQNSPISSLPTSLLTLSVSHWFLFISSQFWYGRSLKLIVGFVYTHTLGDFISSSCGFKYYDMLVTS